MKFLRGLLVFVLIGVIVGGAGYIGYNLLYVNHSGHLTGSNQTSHGDTSQTSNGTSQPAGDTQTGMQMQPQTQNQQTSPRVAFAQQNQDKLVKVISSLNEAMSVMTLDPYAPNKNNATGSANNPSQTGSNTSNNPVTGPQTINVYPQNNQSVNIMPAAPSGITAANGQNGMTAPNSGTTVDQQKMQQLHTGLFKLSQGMVILNQLSDEFRQRAEEINNQGMTQAQQYVLLYNQTVQSRNKLNEAMTYINEAGSLVNINPYQSNGSASYESDKMNQLHEGVMKLAQGTALLNQLNDDLGKQATFSANNANQYSQDSAQSQSTAHGNMPGMLPSVNLTTIFNLILILMVIGLIVGIGGAIYSLIKGPKTDSQIFDTRG